MTYCGCDPENMVSALAGWRMRVKIPPYCNKYAKKLMNR